MARQVLENGVILPAEYSDDWYDDMTSNLTKLDDVIGSDSEKLSPADVGAAALSNNYNDLDNLPTIPTVNDATLTIQKNGVDVQTFTANASSNVTCNITVPTKTSDLTNDSNFVNTSNSAVSSGITSAKVTSYDSHVADTDIHVTTADKNRWNNQTYVFRYSSTALVASSTNNNSLLDNTDNLKVGDKVIDSSGVLFSITAIDTQNSTFTIGTALVDLATNGDVVHKSGNEAITGTKTLDNVNLPFKNSAELGVSGGGTNITFSDKNGQLLCALKAITYSLGIPSFHLALTQKVDNTIYTTNGISLYQQANSKVIQVRPRLANDNADGLSVWLGSSLNTFSRIYGLAYYYGNNNVEFSTKFVTTDTAQTITESKTFTKNVKIKNTDVTRGATTGSGTKAITFTDSSYNELSSVSVNKVSNGSTSIAFKVSTTDNTDALISSSFQFYIAKNGNKVINPTTSEDIALGRSSNKWSDVVTAKVNGVEPSSLGMPDLSNGIDISSYITHLDKVVNSYTPSVNGWISIRVKKTSLAHASLMIYQTGGLLSSCEADEYNISGTNLPVIANQNVEIYIYADALVEAKFFPCQGNV